MELIISILCLLLGGAYCEDQGAGAGQAQPTAVATAGVTPQTHRHPHSRGRSLHAGSTRRCGGSELQL